MEPKWTEQNQIGPNWTRVNRIELNRTEVVYSAQQKYKRNAFLVPKFGLKIK